jgi:hypothetical protein
MKTMVILTAVLFITVFLLPSYGNSTSDATLRVRVKRLEIRTAKLQTRVSILESKVKNQGDQIQSLKELFCSLSPSC